MDALLKICPAVVLAVAGIGCGEDDCAALPSAFELEVRLDIDGERPTFGSLQVLMQAGEDRWWRIYDVSNAFEDDLTSFSVEFVPARSEPTWLTLDLALFSGPSGEGTLLARRSETFELGSDACNAFSMELEISDD